jgi:hypothetical protein
MIDARKRDISTQKIATYGLLLFGIMACIYACASAGTDDPGEEIRGTPIAFPFIDDEKPLETDGPGEKFVIRSAVGPREYAIEIPGAAQDYDVTVPMADLGEKDPEVIAGTRPRDLPSPRQTDQELVSAMPRLDASRETDTSMMDQAFGVGPSGGPRQAPSYTLGIARINRYYREKQLEYCLVEINALLTFYPTAVQLHKMKGTVLIKMRQFKLAEQAWTKALQLDPQDRSIRRALNRLQKRLAAPTTQSEGVVGPTSQPSAVDNQLDLPLVPPPLDPSIGPPRSRP